MQSLVPPVILLFQNCVTAGVEKRGERTGVSTPGRGVHRGAALPVDQTQVCPVMEQHLDDTAVPAAARDVEGRLLVGVFVVGYHHVRSTGGSRLQEETCARLLPRGNRGLQCRLPEIWVWVVSRSTPETFPHYADVAEAAR